MREPPTEPGFFSRHPAAGLFVSKVAAVLGWCGGPMVLCELWTPALGRPVAFAITLLPSLIQTWGWMHLGEPTDSPWALRSIRASQVGNALLVMGQTAGALVLYAGLHTADLGFHAFGTAVGFLASAVHRRRATAWLALAGAQRTRIDLGQLRSPADDESR